MQCSDELVEVECQRFVARSQQATCGRDIVLRVKITHQIRGMFDQVGFDFEKP
jgi:hypothetical protein